MLHSRRSRHRVALAIVALAGSALPLGVSALAEDFPAKPVRMIVAFAPGGSTDVVARMVAQKLTERWAHPMVVENRGGAGTIIGTELVARAEPDGHTLLFTSAAFAINPSLRRTLPYDSLRDLAPVTMAVTSPNLLVVHPSVPATTVAELIELARQRPGTLSFGSSGVGASNHLSGELLALRGGVSLLHVPFRGTGEAVNSLAGGQITMMFDSMVSGLTQVRAGRVRALGVTTRTRAPVAPDVPAIAETLPGYEVNSWLGIFAPGRTAPERVRRISADITWALSAPEVRSRLADLGTMVVANSPPEFEAAIRNEMASWAEVIRATGIAPE